MGTYIEIGGVRTWYDEDGSGEPLVLLHGGLSPNETWGPQMPEFAKHFRVLAPERCGHGHTPDIDGPFSYDDMATDTIGSSKRSSTVRRISSGGATAASSV